MGPHGNRRRAVLFDAMGTLVRLEPPAPRLRAALAARGIEVGERVAARAVRAEIAHYRANLHRGRDAASLEALRAECAGVAAQALGGAADHLPGDEMTAALLEALVFSPFEDAPPVLRTLRRGGVRVVIVSDWDASLPEVLERTGLAPLVDGWVASAVIGVAKPDPEPFAAGLALADVEPARALHVGDSVAADVHGARAAGVTPVLIRRPGDQEEAPAPPDVATIATLAELPALLARTVPLD